jgi:uncharacterized protein (DUF488 family)
MIIYTIGHSNLPVENFLATLESNGIQLLVDIRTIPKSGHNPQFGIDQLPASLADAGINYLHLASLGGLRRAKSDSINIGWRNASFRGYADYMQTPEFAEAIETLVALASTRTTVIMCAEAVPWRCHRSLVGDALAIRGIDVIDIMTATSQRPHRLTSFARVEGMTITYPSTDAST